MTYPWRDEEKIAAELSALESGPGWGDPGSGPLEDVRHFKRAVEAGATWADLDRGYSLHRRAALEARFALAVRNPQMMVLPYGTEIPPLTRRQRARRWLSRVAHRRIMWAFL